MQEDLKKLGLTDNETKVYLSLMKVGETPVGGIISDLKIHRQIAYNALDSLEKKNMVAKTMKNKVFHFKIFDPDILVENIQKQELIAKRLSKKIKSESKKIKFENIVSVYSGKPQVRNYFYQAFKKLPKNFTFQIYTGYTWDFWKVLGDNTINKYNKVRSEKKIKSQLLAGEFEREEQEKLHQKLGVELRQYRFLPFELPNKITTIIMDDYIFYQFFGNISEPYIIEIKQKELRDSFYQNFQLLWKIAKK